MLHGICPRNQSLKTTEFHRGNLGSFSLNGNHEMISPGEGYFKHLFKATGQRTSYGAFQTKHWCLFALDPAYIIVFLKSLVVMAPRKGYRVLEEPWWEPASTAERGRDEMAWRKQKWILRSISSQKGHDIHATLPVGWGFF
mmetsp:Transcript_17430/g.29786  ORF Transcript_17430/g.29786 Transcript_17430/m.29786 type:complete len:141 (+) Transcript_17430:1633-2055(+)